MFRSLKNNVQVIGLPECVEGRSQVEFTECWLKNTFGAERVTLLFCVEQAHRDPFIPHHQVPHFKDRDIILQKGRQHEDLELASSKLSLPRLSKGTISEV